MKRGINLFLTALSTSLLVTLSVANLRSFYITCGFERYVWYLKKAVDFDAGDDFVLASGTLSWRHTGNQYVGEIAPDEIEWRKLSMPIDYLASRGINGGRLDLRQSLADQLKQDFYFSIPCWMLMLPLCILPTFTLIAFLVKRRRRTSLCCPNCGYDLRATPTRCPECGRHAPTARSP